MGCRLAGMRRPFRRRPATATCCICFQALERSHTHGLLVVREDSTIEARPRGYSGHDIERGLEALEVVMRDDPKATVWALPLILMQLDEEPWRSLRR